MKYASVTALIVLCKIVGETIPTTHAGQVCDNGHEECLEMCTQPQ